MGEGTERTKLSSPRTGRDAKVSSLGCTGAEKNMFHPHSGSVGLERPNHTTGYEESQSMCTAAEQIQ